ncbi:MAG TPA: 50S ribosomal protein L13 [Candidatus Paceibacterota bacterium]|nr:50S ribosomal protein L13 [Candidatus Paceibacterota bacterium]
MEYKIDATGEKLGRVASKAATLLMGKDSVDFARNKVSENKVHIENASKISITEKKLAESVHARYSGYPGGLTKAALKQVVEKKGYAELLKHAVSGMLPKNKLRAKMLLNLKITE